jgi:two-component system sensor histidine kinase/response regulator
MDGAILDRPTAAHTLLTALRAVARAVVRSVRERRRRADHDEESGWRQVLEALPQLVWTATPDGLADYFSPQGSTLTGMRSDALLGWGWLDALHPDDRASSKESWSRAVTEGRQYQAEHRFRRFDGEYRWFSSQGTPVRDADGQIIRWAGVCVDVTERVDLDARSRTYLSELNLAEEEMRQATENLTLATQLSGVYIWSFELPNGALDNARATLINVWESLGYETPTQPVDFSASVARVIIPEDQGPVMKAVLAALKGETPQFDAQYRIRHRDGSVHWNLGRGIVLRDSAGVPVRFLGTSVDITQLKEIEAESARDKERLERANRAKDEFLANVSHEIRTPMNAILGMTELAIDSARTDHEKQLLTTVRSAAKSLFGIINDLLDFSKIAAGKLALDEADFWLRAEIGDTLRALAARAHRKGLELICDVHSDVPDALFGDAGRLRQVLMNLVGNAVQFTTRGEVVLEVRLAAVASEGGDDVVPLVFTVRDTGIGIARDKQAAIFRAFEQEDSSTTRRYGGTGLGLTISAELAALMKGTLTVDSEPGRGSVFTYTARFARSSRYEEPGIVSPEGLEGLRVLVVDDNATNRGIVGKWLTNGQMRPTAVGDATSALQELGGGEETGDPYSLVLLDGRMPGVDGITLAAQILERYGPAKRLILLSSDESPILAGRSRGVDIRAYLLKPAQQSDLLETIGVVMNASVGEPPSARSTPSGPADLSKGARSVTLRILVAVDNELNASLLKTLLTKRGHRTQVATDGRLTMKRAIESTFDLLLLDLHMPEIDGFEVVRAIRERERSTGKHLPIVALTARSSSRDRDRCLAAGMDDLMAKPIEADALWAAIDRIAAAFPPTASRESRLLDPRAILRACVGDPDFFDGLCRTFCRTVPEDLTSVRSALRDQDLPRLAEAAHKLFGTLGPFSTIAGAVALTIEDAARREDFESCVELVNQVDSMCAELLEDTRGVTIDGLSL